MYNIKIEPYKISKNSKHNVRQQFKILIVDDDQMLAESFAEILKIRGHNITVANEGVSCVSKCQNSEYDIIFMDFHMDDINGVDVTDVIKNVCRNNSIIFAFTGDDSQMALTKFKNIGMDGAIIKPFDIDTINKLMNSLELRTTIDKRVINAIKELKTRKDLFIFQ